MIEVGLEQVYENIASALDKRDYDTAAHYLWPALDQFPEDSQLLFYASHVFTVQDKLAPAYLCAKRSLELYPTGSGYVNLGAICRRMNRTEEAYDALTQATEYEPENKHSWNNLAASYVNEGNPQPGIIAATKAMELDPGFRKAQWNKGLLELEAQDFKNGWNDYRSGLVTGERMMRSYTEGSGEPAFVEDAAELDKWQQEHGKRPRIIVWGEQGIGDEIMFSTILPDLNKKADIVFECHPRLIKIFRDSYPFIKEFYPTRKDNHITWPADTEKCQFKCSIGDLGRLFRQDLSCFSRAAKEQSPWISADLPLAERYRGTLEEIAPGKKFIGITWTGGILKTQRWYRSVDPSLLSEILMDDQIQPVSLQYENDEAGVTAFWEKHGKMILRFPAVTWAYAWHHTAALTAALDAVITVNQSQAHLSAAMGKRTYVLTPSRPAWRYGLEGKDWFWYSDNATMYRQQGNDWGPALEELTQDIRSDLLSLPLAS